LCTRKVSGWTIIHAVAPAAPPAIANIQIHLNRSSGPTRGGTTPMITPKAQPAYRRTFPYEKGLRKRRVCTAGVAVGFVHEPGDDLDLLRIPRGVDHHHVLRYVAHTGHGVLLGPALP
jgi:hypothetical protein